MPGNTPLTDMALASGSPYFIPEMANENANIANQIGGNIQNLGSGLGQLYSQFLNQGVPNVASQYQNQAALGSMAYANPGTSYGYTAPEGAALEALLKPNELNSYLVANQNISQMPLTKMAMAQQEINDRQAQGAATGMGGTLGALEMQQRALNAPAVTGILNPSNIGNIAAQNQVLQQGQLANTMGLFNATKNLSPETQQKALDEYNSSFGTTKSPEILANPSRLQGPYSPSDENQAIRVGDTIAQASPIAAQYQVAAAQTPQNRQTLNATASAISQLSPSDFATTSNKLDAVIQNLASVVGPEQAGVINKAKSTYATAPNIDNARAYAASLMGVDGNSQIDQSDINKIVTQNKDGSVNFSPGALKTYLQTKERNLDNSIYRNIISQDTIGNLQQNYDQSPQKPGLNNFGSYVENNALQMAKKVDNMTNGYKVPGSSNQILVKNSKGTVVPMSQAEWYAAYRRQGLNDAEIRDQLRQFGEPTKVYMTKQKKPVVTTSAGVIPNAIEP